MNAEHFGFVIVGAGFSGAVLAERIANALKKSVLVLEKRNHIGGNAFDFKEGGITVQKYGPHIFHTNNEKVWNYVSRFTEWVPYKHRVRAFVKGKFVPLPFNFKSVDLLFPIQEAERYKNALSGEFGLGNRVSIFDLEDSENPLVRELADFIYENVFLNYTTKQWGIAPEQVDRNVLKRVPVAISYEDVYFKDKFQGIPKNGFTSIFEKMLASKRIKVILKTDFSDIFTLDLKSHKVLLKNGKEFKGIVFYTGCPDELFNFKFGKLPYRSLDFEFEKLPLKRYQDTAVVNYPNDFEFTRITEFKHFYKSPASGTVIAKEFPKEPKAGDIPYYPVVNLNSKNLYREYKNEAGKFGKIFLTGRLANFKYINMDEAVSSALSLAERFGIKI